MDKRMIFSQCGSCLCGLCAPADGSRNGAVTVQRCDECAGEYGGGFASDDEAADALALWLNADRGAEVDEWDPRQVTVNMAGFTWRPYVVCTLTQVQAVWSLFKRRAVQS